MWLTINVVLKQMQNAEEKKKSGVQDSEAWPLPASSAHCPHQTAKAGHSLAGWKAPKHDSLISLERLQVL